MPSVLASWHSSRTLLAALLLLPLLPPALGGCGECVFDQRLQGVVVDQSNQPVVGAELTTCFGERCDHDPGNDTGCTGTTTDASGHFSLVVAQCRPAPFECELRPVTIARAGCDTTVVQLGLTGDEVTLGLVCP